MSLRELYAGTSKKLKITRRVADKATGQLASKEVRPIAYFGSLLLQALSA